jgi:hypothetical protein
MFGLKVTVGSRVEIPLPAGWQVAAMPTSIVSVAAGRDSVILTALAAGRCTLTLSPATDLSVALLVQVVI